MKKLKSRKTYYSELFQGQELGKYLGLEEYFDQNKNLIEIKTIGEDGEIVVSETREYEGDKIKMLVVQDFETNHIQKSGYFYAENLLIGEIEYFENESFIKSSISYNSEKKIWEIHKTDESDHNVGKLIYGYDGNTQTIEEYDEEKNLYKKEIILKDSFGNEIENKKIEYFSEEEEVATTTKNLYDSNNRLITEETERLGRVLFKQTNTYDSFGNLINSEIFNNEIDYLVTIISTYSSQNLLISEIVLNDSKQVYKSVVSYDSNQNPIEKIMDELEIDDFKKVYKEEIINEYW